ncbi:MAG: TetR/AcrR family transcriptional regulator [Gemmatimonadetes bacterium]|nr:TetR/AcrR family transcriptional regulator [Gemmatimonadota bacterium]
MAERQDAELTRSKGERTRDRIRLVTVELLNEVGYRDLKVAEICERAAISPPVLYLYFENKEALTADVLQEFLDRFLTREPEGDGATPYEAILSANQRWIALARENAGLMRCLLQFSEEVPAFARIFRRASHLWYERIARSVIRRYPTAAAEEPAIQLIAHALGGLVDEVTRKLFADPDPHVRKLAATVAPGDTQLAHMLSVIWHRALYGCDATASDGASLPLAPRLAAARQRERRR